MTIPVITIDGPSGSGKGTVGQLLARELGWHYLDSGAIYRLLAYAAIQSHTAFTDEAALSKLASQLKIRFVAEESSNPRVLLDEQDVTKAIRTEECGKVASVVGAFANVRTALLERQRAFRQAPGLVTDGRDMGSIIFPDAALKIFLEASVLERARRRHLQLLEQGINVSLDTLCEELAERDRRDRERTVAPLKPAPDAFILDTTGLSIEQVLAQLKEKAQQIFAN